MKNFNLLICALLFISFLTSCVDREFDLPPIPEPADLETNATIADLKALQVPGSIITITEDFTIKALVAANDRSGNYFKRIIVQDETGGIEIAINVPGLSPDFPVGSTLFIKTKGLVLGAPRKNLILGGSVSGSSILGIEQILLDEYLVKGIRNGTVEPKVKTISELGTADESTLITLENVEFADDALGQTLATEGETFGKNLTLRDCDGNTLVVRTSDFADFAGVLTPCGNGTITGIYSVYDEDDQFFIREIEEVQLTENRCDGSEPCAGENGEQIDISEVRALFTGTTTTAPAGKFIKGIVISDRANSNLPSLNIVVQQPGDKGIVVRFVNNPTFNLNDEVTVDISGMEIEEYNGLLQVNNVPNFRAKSESTGTITPKVLTISQILADFENLESTLVKINDVTVTSSNNTLAFTSTITDESGSMDLFTTNYSTFANNAIPTNEVDITAIVSQGGNESARNVSVRNLMDIDGYNGGGGGDPEKMTIAAVRSLFSGSNTSVPTNRFIEGVVISDRANENITGRNLVIQEPGGKGIVVRFVDVHSINLNSIIKVNVGGMEVSEFDGLLQINNVPNANASVTGTGSITPNVLTISQILSDFENLESTLVRIQNVTITKPSGTTFDKTTVLNDGTGTMDLFTTSYSSFANQNFPTGAVNITGIVNQGGPQESRQISIRNPGLDIE